GSAPVPGPARGPHARDRSGAGTLSGGRPGIGQADMSALAGPPEAAPGEMPHQEQGRVQGGPPERECLRREEAPPRMRWRGPPDLATPDAAISCSASVPLDQPPSRTPARSPSCPVPLAFRGAPRMVSVFGSERFVRLSDAAAQGVSGTNFKILSPSTNCPQFSRSYPPVDSNSPHEIHRRILSGADGDGPRAGGGRLAGADQRGRLG